MHLAALSTILQRFGKSINQVCFLISDNSAVNKRLARIMGVPLVGCASHRLNLAVRLYTAPLENALAGIQKLMVKLRTLNHAAKLRFKTTLRPVLRNDTRWSSTFAMLDHYVRLLEFIDREDDAVAELLPSPSVHKKLKGLLEDLKQFESVSNRLKSESVSLWEVRVMFDALIAEKPALKQYLGPRADIVASPDFESACLINVIPPTSNLTERLFSMARSTFGLERHSLSAQSIEMILFLKVNRSYWDAPLVHESIKVF
ncbi:hypothetical protein PHYSODRAFT_521288 [Phytophthora sojae]|uniref:HAT C-terminal dimerisation domain-containing protein n=1 Tax=Phytophthora sojae (strain P6497) TaxID=1094619 RepID=G5A1N7_PHYSP|nr:hypothetical protein PHYSODRAFT_521288 [Phytophthora sojae]EGZ10835.1 hypothetical protein PHYSODRAFT_521288 [Phytophthora sojae]|eukprot:XP_009533580.1 hypothetical protein PHYSODRAFT_521288 [Phytophthora sojae]